MKSKLICAYILDRITDGQMPYSSVSECVIESFKEKHPEEKNPDDETIRKKILDLINESCIDVKTWDSLSGEYFKSEPDFENRLCFFFITESGRARLDDLWTKELDILWNSD